MSGDAALDALSQRVTNVIRGRPYIQNACMCGNEAVSAKDFSTARAHFRVLLSCLDELLDNDIRTAIAGRQIIYADALPEIRGPLTEQFWRPLEKLSPENALTTVNFVLLTFCNVLADTVTSKAFEARLLDTKKRLEETIEQRKAKRPPPTAKTSEAPLPRHHRFLGLFRRQGPAPGS